MIDQQQLQRASHDFDMIIIGAGFGGIATALTLAQAGKHILLLEKLNYAGGCAGTFIKKGHTFEAGATLSSGFNQGQIFDQWCHQYQLDVKTHVLDPALSFFCQSLKFEIPTKFEEYLSVWEKIALQTQQANPTQIKAFFKHQQIISNALWAILDDPSALPDMSVWQLIKYWQKIPSFLPLIPNLNLSLFDVLQKYDLHTFAPLCLFLNALCQITLQCNIHQANANFALATMDYYFRGVRHIEGGIGQLATALCTAIEQEGGIVKLAHGVQKISKDAQSQKWQVQVRGQQRYTAPIVIANLQPKAILKLLESTSTSQIEYPKKFQQKQKQIQDAWSAALWYLVLPCQQDSQARHLQMIDDPQLPLQEGNHLFCSFSQASQASQAFQASQEQEQAQAQAQDHQPMQYYQSVTISTHIPLQTYLKSLQDETVADYIHQIQEKMLRVFDFYTDSAKSKTAKHAFPASPRTIERFTGRPFGAVGGIPKTKGFSSYLDFGTQEVLENLHLVGDSFFPGQSTLACALGGIRLANSILQKI